MITISFMAMWLAKQPAPMPETNTFTISSRAWLPVCCKQLDGYIECAPGCTIRVTFPEGGILPGQVNSDVELTPRSPVFVPGPVR